MTVAGDYVRAGRFNNRVTLQAPVETQDTFGSAIKSSWTNIRTVWAEVMDLTGIELYRVQEINAEISVQVVIRQRSGITPKCRVLYLGRVLEVVSAAIDGQLTVLLCKEAV
jgi:SPP1 family predicted phage head-tail adaptor